MAEVLQLVVRDIVEAPWLLVVLAAPLVLGVVAARAGSRLGWVALGLIAALVLAYLAYYTIPLPNIGAAPAALIVLLVGLVACATAALGYREGRGRAPLRDSSHD